MLEHCSRCGAPFITEADSFVVEPITQSVYCLECGVFTYFNIRSFFKALWYFLFDKKRTPEQWQEYDNRPEETPQAVVLNPNDTEYIPF